MSEDRCERPASVDEVRALRERVRELEDAQAERLRAESELRESERRLAEANHMLQLVLDTIPVRVFWKDPQLRYLGCNRLFAEDAGRSSPDELIGRDDHEMGWRNEAELYRADDRCVIDTLVPKINYEEPQTTPSGGQIWLRTSKIPLRDADGELVGVLGTYEDVTEQKEAERALRASEQSLSITLDSIGDAVISTDVEGRVVRMNPVAERLTGWTISEARGLELAEVFHIVNAESRLPVETPVARVLEDGAIVGLANHTLLISRDGTECQIADSGAPIRGAEDRIEGVVLVFRDVTAEHSIRAQLHHSRKMEAIGQLAGGIAHDFNNLLAGVMGNAQLLGMTVEPGSTEAGIAAEIVDAASRAADLTRQLLTFSHKTPFRLVEVDVHVVLDRTVELLVRSIDRRVEILRDYNAPRAVVQGDPTGLQNALLNLGVNARDAMPEGGVLTFSTRLVALDEEGCRGLSGELCPGEHLEIAVRDTGCGMAPEVMERVFEPFFTTKAAGAGTGLGLASVYGCLTGHRGAVKVESKPGMGTTFTLVLPLADPGARPRPEQAERDVVRGQGHVLVVDDEPSVRRFVEAALARLGYRVTSCCDGLEAVEVFERLGAELDLVIVDLVMPRMSGRDALRRIRGLSPRTPVLVATGYSDGDSGASLLAAGASGLLTKPFRVDDLSREVARCIALAKG